MGRTARRFRLQAALQVVLSVYLVTAVSGDVPEAWHPTGAIPIAASVLTPDLVVRNLQVNYPDVRLEIADASGENPQVTFDCRMSLNGAVLAEHQCGIGQVNVPLQQLAAGVYTLKYEVDINNAVAETNENNNEASVNFTVGDGGDLPDLAVENLQVDYPDVSLEIAELNNQDSQEQFTCRALLNGGLLSESPCGPGPVDFTLDLEDGDYTLRFEVDIDDAVAESDELNNSAEASFNVGGEGLPNWTFRGRMKVKGKKEVGKAVRPRVKIVNVGAAREDLETPDISWYRDGTFEARTPAVNGSSEYAFYPGKSGETIVEAVIDASRVLYESDRSDNTASTAVDIDSGREFDLAPTGPVLLNATNTSLRAFAQTTLIGQEPYPDAPYSTAYHIATNAISCANLPAPAAIVTWNGLMGLPEDWLFEDLAPNRQYYVAAVSDPTGSYEETDEGNNCVSGGPFTTLPLDGSDLVAGQLTLTHGESPRVRLTPVDLGDRPYKKKFKVALYTFKDGERVLSKRKNSKANKTVTFRPDLEDGSHLIEVVVDDTNRNDGEPKTNNSETALLTVGAVQDWDMRLLDIRFLEGGVGSALFLVDWVVNVFSGAPYKVALFVNSPTPPTCQTTPYVEVEIDPSNTGFGLPGVYTTRWYTFVNFLPVGKNTIHALVDSECAYLESDESDNLMVRHLTLQAPE